MTTPPHMPKSSTNLQPAAQGAVSRRACGLHGDVVVPGDKSISHRALIMGALAVGETTITGLLTGEDVLRTAKAMDALGARIDVNSDEGRARIWRIRGRGIGGLTAPSNVLDLGNSGTGHALSAGFLAPVRFRLSSRAMRLYEAGLWIGSRNLSVKTERSSFPQTAAVCP